MCDTLSPKSKAIVNELREEVKRQQATMEPSYDEFRDEAKRRRKAVGCAIEEFEEIEEDNTSVLMELFRTDQYGEFLILKNLVRALKPEADNGH